MGQKVHPYGMRLGIVTTWNSTWYAERKDYAKFLHSDNQVREYLRKRLPNSSISRIQIERLANTARVILHTARPGVVIGKKGQDIEKLRASLIGLLGLPCTLSVEEIRKPEMDAYLVADGIAQQLEKRVMFRRAMKRAVANAMRLGAKGIRICVSGRLNGNEIARSEWYLEGSVSLHTLRADIDYGIAEAKTTYGVIGVKVWISKGEIINTGVEREERRNDSTVAASAVPKKEASSEKEESSEDGGIKKIASD